ncbi:MAG: hypothetical protein CMA64_06545 [Euryarchaeota archaeon]|nr:hypothetical protein [Euryarchaeota archaeon]|tara:strand:+ start:253 stop:465 length:213 start_codon:yes stop_codon:yes gene_type:complete
MDEILVEKCTRAAFVELDQDDEAWVRVDGFDPDEKILYVHNENSGEEFSLEAEDLEGAKFYELKHIIIGK